MSPQDWERKFNAWSQGPGSTEDEKCENAERMVRDAIRSHSAFKNRNVRIFTQGSYRNRTNVRMDSDVDVCVLCMDTFVPDYSHVPDIDNNTLGFTNADYTFEDLKKDVYDALVVKFGKRSITPGDKAFDIKENTYRVAADVVPTFEGRLYYRDVNNNLKYHSGTVLECSKDRRMIKNWPQQHYDNGVYKHNKTARKFKKKARCLKNLSNEMQENGFVIAEKMASFLLESLVYNCTDEAFNHITHYEDMKEVVRYLYNKTRTDDESKDMIEVNGIKYLFHVSQAWERESVNKFLLEAWQYVGFKN